LVVDAGAIPSNTRLGGTFRSAAIYEVSRWYRSRQGVRLEQAFAEIPVE
jgi:hypothetical protein